MGGGGHVKMRTIAVDATGGDHAPFEVVRAAAELSREGELTCRIIGDANHLRSLLGAYDHDPARVTLTDAATIVDSMDAAVWARSSSALEAAAGLVRSGEADAAVSAGDTGECVRIWLREFPLLPGLTRPALASFFPRRALDPSRPNVGLLLDVGATLRCHPKDYLGLAIMGAMYYETLTGHRGRVGLLNVGGEAHKGGEPLAKSLSLLGDLGDQIDFVGNVEATNLWDGHVDVVLCDGFTGNVLLKTLEGVAETAAGLVRDALHQSWLWRFGIYLLSGGIKTLQQATDYAEYGGSPLLGCSALFIKAHGRSNARALKNAIRAAGRAADTALPARVAEALATVHSLGSRSWLRFGRSSTD